MPPALPDWKTPGAVWMFKEDLVVVINDQRYCSVNKDRGCAIGRGISSLPREVYKAHARPATVIDIMDAINLLYKEIADRKYLGDYLSQRTMVRQQLFKEALATLEQGIENE